MNESAHEGDDPDESKTECSVLTLLRIGRPLHHSHEELWNFSICYMKDNLIFLPVPPR